MNDMRERLAALLDRYVYDDWYTNEDIAKALIENGVILPPCKVGDTVYNVWYTECHNGETFPDSYECCRCKDECDMGIAIFEMVVPNIRFVFEQFVFREDNCVYFLTREDAERALKEREQDGC